MEVSSVQLRGKFKLRKAANVPVLLSSEKECQKEGAARQPEAADKSLTFEVAGFKSGACAAALAAEPQLQHQHLASWQRQTLNQARNKSAF
jgi:hypothetical protein